MAIQPILDIHDLVEELTRTHSHREPYVRDRDGHGTRVTLGHITTVPSLIEQLVNAAPAGSGENAGSDGARSRPTARIEALDTLDLIDDEAGRWITRLGHTDPRAVDQRTGRAVLRGSTTAACIRRIHALHAGLKPCDAKPHRGCCQAHDVEHAVRRWWHQARIVSGWDSAAWRPDNTCPLCKQRRTLRINWTTQSAICVECREVWEPAAIGLLAEHIRAENQDDADAV